MRDILFRGKRKSDESWIYGRLSYNGLGDTMKVIENNFFKEINIVSDTIGQYTGITDKNDNKIFEGDIVKATIHRCYGSNPQTREETKIIAYDNLGILGLKDDEDVWSDFMNELSLSGCIENFYFEVIGNIHDNPELLKYR